MNKTNKKVILMVIDACASRVFNQAIKSGKLPNLQALAEAGQLKPQSIAIFPSLTPAATSTLFTGDYPSRHGILGFHWYDLDKNEVAYYGDDFWTIARRGVRPFFEDLLLKLNHERLQAETAFQRIERSGLKAACFNFLMFRGDVEHKANVPLLLGLIPGVPFSEVICGPSTMFYGDLVNSNAKGKALETIGGMFRRFGFNDDNTFKLLHQFAEQRAFPDFSIAYFPDNDYFSHDVGPNNAVTTLEHFDEQLGTLFEIYGGLEQLLSEVTIILTGDHAQSVMVDDEEDSEIRLDHLLSDFTIATVGQPWGDNDQLVICPDMRCAQIYFKDLNPKQIEHILALLIADKRVDQLIWQAKYLGEGDKGYYVTTLDRGRLKFWPGADGPNHAVDAYGCPWSWEGSLAAVGGQLNGDNIITFETYPNAFERIAGALDNSNSGHLWLTARLGYEFGVAETSIHVGGGSHGSLHKLDSTSPLLVAGASSDLALPDQPRAVDIAPLCFSLLGVESPYPMGASRKLG
ncbi:MAG TPA: alkaline phosphatase family protein [Anaerolineae bacterium]|nr:alkaline phosphatase family protein [Anaerolineae bacterium]MCB9108897.1 alkaline phosphatase family protein [Anaerolineales bacterium]HRV91686.1 alkaline phosphatase family protein [Anaerolineae bacterium]